MGRIGHVTAREIASIVGVSRQSVSGVLSGSSPTCVVSSTRERIEKVARELGYRANPAALRLGGHKTGRVGLVVSSYGFGLGFAERLAEEFMHRDYHPLLMIVRQSDEVAIRVRELIGGGIDGLFIGSETVFRHADFSLPLLKFEFADHDIGVDYESSGRIAAEHLQAHGHRNLAYLELERLSSSSRKFSGCKAVCPSVKRLTLSGNPQFALEISGYLSAGITGFICSDDLLAARTMQYISSLGGRIPEDAAVIGYGGYAYAAVLQPQLTTLEFPVSAMAQQAAELLVAKMQHGVCQRLPEPVLLSPLLVCGGSCGCSAPAVSFPSDGRLPSVVSKWNPQGVAESSGRDAG